METLHTPGLRLEPLVEAHAEALFTGLRHEALYEFISERMPESVETLAERYRRLESRSSPDGRDAWLNWALWSLGTGRYVGWVQATVHSDHSAHIAYVLFHDAWGHGYAREAVQAVIEHLRDGWHATLVLATVDLRNRRSIALLEALGFQRGAVWKLVEESSGTLSDEADYARRLDTPQG